MDADADAAAHWSYERSGADLVGVRVAQVPGRASPVVVTSWADEGLAGLDGLTGTVALARGVHAGEGPGPGHAHYRPETVTGCLNGEGQLRVAGSVVLLETLDELAAFDAVTGAHLWQRPLPECNRTAAMGAHVVIDAGCFEQPAKALVLDARSGEQTQELVPPPFPPSTEPTGGSPGLWFDGCREDGADCGLLRYDNGGGSDHRARYWTMGDDGRLVPAEKGDGPESGDVQPRNGEDGIQVIDALAAGSRWSHDGDLRGLDRPMFAHWSNDPLLPADEVLWVSSFSWHGNIPVLAKLNARNGKVLGCEPPPTGKAATYLKTFDRRRVIIGSFFGAEIPPDAEFALVVPKPGRCPKTIRAKVAVTP